MTELSSNPANSAESRGFKDQKASPECACPICRELPESTHAYLDRDDELPVAAKQLLSLDEGHFRRCPVCNTYYHFFYWPPGPGNIGDREDLDRFSPEDNRWLKPLLEASSSNDLEHFLFRGASSAAEETRNRAEYAFSFLCRKHGFQALLPLLIPLLTHAERAVKVFAVTILQASAHKEDLALAVPALKALLPQKDWLARGAADALTRQFLREENWSKLKKLLSFPNEWSRLGAFYRLQVSAFLQRLPESLLGSLQKGLKSRNQDIRHWAGEALKAMSRFSRQP